MEVHLLTSALRNFQQLDQSVAGRILQRGELSHFTSCALAIIDCCMNCPPMRRVQHQRDVYR